jgi:hypothetical protein
MLWSFLASTVMFIGMKVTFGMVKFSLLFGNHQSKLDPRTLAQNKLNVALEILPLSPSAHE